MSTPDFMPSLELSSDAELVIACLGGDREAFRRIVERYQRLLCSLAYSATGQLSQSEDLAQEAFVDAWRQLRSLRDPEKLRPWLCGILRFKVSRLRRADGREPVRQAGPLALAEEIPATEDPAAIVAMQKEEQALLWSALERVPASYREPLVLFYREHRSVEHVAAALDLTEDAVKQRLARGRRILQEEVLSFVEGALARSTPGNLFTLGVLAALPQLAPAKAAGLGAAAAHGGILAKSATVAALLASISGVVSAVLTLRANLDQARTPTERRAVVKITLACFLGSFAYLGVLYAVRAAAQRRPEELGLFAGLCFALVLAAAIAWPVALLRTMRRQRALRSSERRAHPELFRAARDQVGSAAGEYRSRARLLGVPLVHVRFATPDEGQPPVFAWFAGGDRAFGLVAAWGGCAVAPFSVGAISVGLFSVGALSLGLISYGTVSLGLLAIGCASIGLDTGAWLAAFGWHSAQGGGFAVAHHAALGPLALAPHANDTVAQQLLINSHVARDNLIMLSVGTLMALIPIAYYARSVRQRLGSPRDSGRTPKKP